MAHNKKSVINRLDTLIKAASDRKTASPGDDLNKDNGTGAVQTGMRMSENKTDAAKSTKAMVDGGATVNPSNASVTMSTDGASAVSTNGQHGATGGVLAVKGEAPNDKGGSIKSASLQDQLRAAAAAAEAPVVKVAEVATPKGEVKPVLTKEAALDAVRSVLKTAAPRELSNVEKFVAKHVKAGSIKVAGDVSGMSDGGAADTGVQDLIKKLTDGSINEEQAEQILMAMLQDGSVSKDELVQAMGEMHAPGAAGDPAAAGAPGGDAGAPPAGDPSGAGDPGAAAAGAPAGGDAPPADAGMDQAKVAMLHIDENHPQYFSKLALLYPDEMTQASQACVHFAELLIKAAEATPGGDLNADNGTKKVEEAPGTAKPSTDKGATAAAVDTNVAAKLPAAKDGAKTGGDAGAMPVAPPTDPAAGGPPADSAGGPPTDPMASAGIAPQGADEQAALAAFLKQTGLTPESLMQLLQAQAGAPADPSMAKAASYIHKVAALVASKAAQFELATPVSTK